MHRGRIYNNFCIGRPRVLARDIRSQIAYREGFYIYQMRTKYIYSTRLAVLIVTLLLRIIMAASGLLTVVPALALLLTQVFSQVTTINNSTAPSSTFVLPSPVHSDVPPPALPTSVCRPSWRFIYVLEQFASSNTPFQSPRTPMTFKMGIQTRKAYTSFSSK